MNTPPTTTIVLSHVLLVQNAPRGFAELAASTGLPFATDKGAGACRLTMPDGRHLLIEERHGAAIKAALARGDRTIEVDGRCEWILERKR